MDTEAALPPRDIFEIVRGAIIWAKSEIVTLGPGQIERGSLLSEPPICLDSLEAIAMVTHLEADLGLVARDEHFFSGSVRTVADVVSAAEEWIAQARPSSSAGSVAGPARP